MSKKLSQSLLRNSALSALATGLPILAVLVSIPYLLNELGNERFGLISLIFAVLAYSTALNAGLGKAVTQRVAKNYENDDARAELGTVVWTATAAQFVFGILGGALITVLAKPIVELMDFTENPSEAVVSIQLLGGVVPIMLVTTTFRGLFQATGRFGLVAAIDAPIGTLLYLLPVIAVASGRGVPAIVILLIISRLVGLFVYYILAVAKIPEMSALPEFSIKILRELLSFGVWVAISDVIFPLFAYIDRFIVGAFLGISKVASYSVAQDIVNRLWLVPTSIVSAVMPAASTFSLKTQRAGILGLFAAGTRMMAITIGVGAGLLALFSDELLAIWISEEFSAEAAPLLRIFLVGLVLNSLAMISSALLLGQGMPQWRTAVHLLEIPVYVVAVVVLIPTYGLEGAAWAWVVRMTATLAGVQILARLKLGFGYRDLPTWPLLLGTGTPIAFFFVCDFYLYLMTVPAKIGLASAAVVAVGFAIRRQITRSLKSDHLLTGTIK